ALQRHELGPRPLAQRGLAQRAQAQAAGEPALTLARPSSERRHPPRGSPEQRDHAIRFAVADGAENDGGRPEGAHAPRLAQRGFTAADQASREPRPPGPPTSAASPPAEGRALSPSPDGGGRRRSSESVIVAMSSKMMTNTARPRPRRGARPSRS